jgi:hypothetical protein
MFICLLHIPLRYIHDARRAMLRVEMESGAKCGGPGAEPA